MRIKFFITPVYPYDNDHYYHEIIALAEGFEELGFTIFSNADYWWQPEKKCFLLAGNLEDTDYDIGIYSSRYVKSFEHLLFRKGYPSFEKKAINILIHRNSWISPYWRNKQYFEAFDLICSGNLFSNINYHKKIKPWGNWFNK